MPGLLVHGARSFFVFLLQVAYLGLQGEALQKYLLQLNEKANGRW